MSELAKSWGPNRSSEALKVAAISGLLLIPCVWQRYIECADLPSHLYNAWLYLEAQSGRLPGLTVVHPATNFLVDELFAGALQWWSPVWAERVVVALSVLVFFWGSWRLISRITGRRLWGLCPLLAMLTFGVVFRWGFINFYLSAGLCFWAMSFLWEPIGRDWLWGLLLTALAIAAHAAVPAWMVGVLLYRHLAKRIAGVQRLRLFGGAVCLLVLAHFALRRLDCVWPHFSLRHPRVLAGFVGLSQLAPYGAKYWALAIAVVCLWIPAAILSIRRLSAKSIADDIVLQVVALQVVWSVLSPEGIVRLPGYAVGLYLLNARLSLLTAVLMCALLARTASKFWGATALAAIAALFFVFSFADERAINQIEARVESAVDAMPPGRSVVMTLREVPERGGVAPFAHIVDRACIARCYDYANYEPATGQFRVRASHPNPFVLWDPADVVALESGAYTVRKEDPPIYQIRVCNPQNFGLCTVQIPPGQAIATDPVSLMPAVWRSKIDRQE